MAIAQHDEDIIKSVLGFNFNVNVTYTNEEGKEVPICKGCRSVMYHGDEHARIGVAATSQGNFFTNFNQALLDKIKDYQSKHC